MPQPSLDDVRVFRGFEEVDSGRMAHAMGGKTFYGERGATLGGKSQVFFEDGTYAEAGEGARPLIDEKMIGGSLGRSSAVMPPIEFKELNGRRPHGRESFFVAFADNLDDSVLEIEPGDSDVGGLLGSSAGVMEENEDAQVPDPVRSGRGRLSQKRLQFLGSQELRWLFLNALDGNGQDASGVSFEVRVVECEIFEKGLDGDQALIARSRRIIPAIDGIFQMLEEGKDGFGVQVLDEQRPAFRMLEAEIGDQEFKGVAVAADGVDADAFLPTQIGLQEFRKMVLEVVCH